jgi:hypothetical protein
MRTHRALLLLPTLMAACTQNAPVQYRVPDLRVLAIRGVVSGTANTADPDPGGTILGPYKPLGLGPGGTKYLGASETLNLTALVANPLNRTGVNVRWFACAPPLQGSPCDPTQLRDLDAFETTPGVFSLGPSAPLGPGETLSNNSINFDSVPAELRAGIYAAMLVVVSPEFTYPCARYAELPVIAIVRGEGVAEATLKRVRLRPTRLLAALEEVALAVPEPPVPDYYIVNLNPGLRESSPGVADLQVNPLDPEPCTGGSPLPTSLPAAKATICAAAAVSVPPDTYYQCNPGASLVDEMPELQWYVTAGEIAGSDFDGNAEGTHIDFTPAAGSSFRLWVIVRDGNGGTDWAYLDLSSP